MLRKIICSPLAVLLELLTIFLLPFPILIFAALRSLIPNNASKALLTNWIENIALLWNDVNYFIFRYLLKLEIEIIGAENITPHKNYFVIANHQSWVDILMLEQALRNRSGFSRYFIKKNLLHVPLAGWACRGLHYPYMYRFTKEHLAKHPEDKGKDIAITKKACANLRGIYFKLNNFPEGTRFTEEKHQRQASPYRFLLKPKTGGIAYALEILHDQLDAIIDMTILYAEKPNVVQLFLGNMKKVKIIVEKLPITPDLIGNYQDDQNYRIHFQGFITNLWQKKDQLIAESKEYRHTTASPDQNNRA